LSAGGIIDFGVARILSHFAYAVKYRGEALEIRITTERKTRSLLASSFHSKLTWINNVSTQPVEKIEKVKTERLSANVTNNRFNRTHCSKRSAVFVRFLVLPGSMET